MSSNKSKKKQLIKSKRIILSTILLIFIISILAILLHMNIKNIYIIGNNIISDKEIIEASGLSNYPPLINTYFINIKNKIEKNDYIKNVEIDRQLIGKIYLYIEEYSPIAIYKDNLILSSSKKVNNQYNINYVPYIVNDIDSIYERFVEKFNLVDKNVLYKISHIEYSPLDVDTERFILYMIDDNYVHITLSKIEKLNKYNSVVAELEGKKGIIYLDSGDYVEIKAIENND